MNTTTRKSMILLAQRNDRKINAFVPQELNDLIEQMAAKNKMNVSSYIRIAMINQVEQDMIEQQ